jgi:5-methylcytosine-specific restriction enzyme B
MSESEATAGRPAWFVGATYNGHDDQLPRFLKEGIWENGYADRYLDQVRAMRVGDRIAVKAAYTRKHQLPFDNRGHTTSVLAIKAVGTIVGNPGDGRRLKVDWTPLVHPKEWYFYTNRGTLWRVESGSWEADALLAFTFEGKAQEIDRFRNAPAWRARYGDLPTRFGWTTFYQAFADALRSYRHRRPELIEGLRGLNLEGLWLLEGDRFADGSTGFLRDICPFTTMGLFNRGLKESNRRAIAEALGKLIGVTEPVPKTFEGIPVLNNQRSWFFPFEKGRPVDQIDNLWEVFDRGIALADAAEEADRDAFAAAYDRASANPIVGWTLSCGLYWARPWQFVTLDSGSRSYITTRLQLPMGFSGPKKRSSGQEYLALRDRLLAEFPREDYPVHSFPELSLAAWGHAPPGPEPEEEEEENVKLPDVSSVTPPEPPAIGFPPYTIDHILEEGCFLDRNSLETMLERWENKKNLVLQGPPGTGKTWLARRLAFALIGKRDENKVRAVQFHPNLSYEDFVRGWRPSGDGRLGLVDGLFMEAVRGAQADPSTKMVVVIEEINRGNPAQIFGELLTLLEAGKRHPRESLQLSYPDPVDGQRRPVYLPENLFVIGTMNLADRSLALVDMALRRRFAFVSLEPRLGEAWREWVVEKAGVDSSLASELERRIQELNRRIAADHRLGGQYRVGQSFVTPSSPLAPGGTRAWFMQVVETELQPLLEELWFENPAEAERAVAALLQGW